jgi:kinesin family member 11
LLVYITVMGDSETDESSVRVVCRFRPFNEVEKAHVEPNPFLVTTSSVRDLGKGYVYERFDAVCDEESSQSQVYDVSCGELVADLLRGFNVGLFAYGQSGGGKSYSLLGKEGCLLDDEYQGIIPRHCNKRSDS